jgi:hypothetical protein
MKYALLTAALLSIATPALAQEQRPCGPLAEMEGKLAKEFHENRVQQGIGEMNGSHLTAVYATADGATWTIMTVDPTGVACVVDTGTDWQVRNDAPAVPEQGS